MTDDQILKAMEHCISTKPCEECPICNADNCVIVLTRNALDLIKRQQAEIESLEADYENVYKQASADILASIADGGTSCEWCIDKHRAEAVREFAKRLKEAFPQTDRNNICPALYYDDYCYIIDELAEEMTEKEGSNNGIKDKH